MNDEIPKPQDWVPFAEGVREILRRQRPDVAPPWSKELVASATARLLDALRAGTVGSKGRNAMTGETKPLLRDDWQHRELLWKKNWLVHAGSRHRRVPHGFEEVELSGADIHKHFQKLPMPVASALQQSAPPSAVALEVAPLKLNEQKSAAVHAAFGVLGPSALKTKPQKERGAAISKWVLEERGLKISDEWAVKQLRQYMKDQS